MIGRLAGDLRAEFPDQRGWSAPNLQCMRGFATGCPALEIVPWGHVRALLDRLDNRADRDWYAAEATGQAGAGLSWFTRSAPGCTPEGGGGPFG